MRLTCEQAVQQFCAYLDRALLGEEVADLEAHPAACLRVSAHRERLDRSIVNTEIGGS
ncbi:MAG: hypothetical protein ACREM3_19585 [Candidatus Rokuibacteriota bacterium]